MTRLKRFVYRTFALVTLACLISSGVCTAAPTGDCDGDGKVSVVDALIALRVSVGLDPATTQVLRACDIGPLDAKAISRPDGQLMIDDALIIIKRALGISSWDQPANVEVPNLVGQPQPAAQTALTASGLKTGKVNAQLSEAVPQGNVVIQVPAAGASVEPGCEVSLVVSSGPTGSRRTIPDVVGLTERTAADSLSARGYQLGNVSTISSAAVTSGTIISQFPTAGTDAGAGATVDVLVSGGPPAATITVPNVIGLAQADAANTLTEASLRAGTVSFDSSATVAPGVVISQCPPANAMAVSGSAVSMVVSTGQAVAVSLPPDPATVASPVDPKFSTSFAAATAFLYTGTPPIQTGVTLCTIDANRAAVLRGKVLDKSNQPLSGVSITVKDHPEFGRTHSRSDGYFDLAVNGGGYLTVVYDKGGYLPSQRRVNVQWKDFAWLPDVVLIQLDPKVTTVDLTSPVPIQSVQGSEVSDADGTRQATLLVSGGTTASMQLPDGSAAPLTSLSIRATEYTVGDNGPKAMPGQLPATTAYTYAVEFSADEAINAGAATVSFTKPLYAYLDNFPGFPVGGAVPTGYYDRQKGEWIPSENGRVINIVGITEEMADLDVDGSGNVASAASLALLNITDAERVKLAELYPAVPKQLWRVPIRHFTPWDCNWPYGPPNDAEPPPPIHDPDQPPTNDPCDECGSVIEAQNRSLGETIPLAGTPYTLNYRSNRTPGFAGGRALNFQISGPSVPGSLIGIQVTLLIAGRNITQAFPAQPSQTFSYTWDGRDAFGRYVRSTPYTIKLDYVYPTEYYPVSADLANAFARIEGSSGEPAISGIREASTVTITQSYHGVLNGASAESPVLPYWSLDVHHFYDPATKTLHYGSGETVDARQITGGGDVIEVVGSSSLPVKDVAIGPDGSLYFAESANNATVVKKRGVDGAVSTVAGNGTCSYDSIGDGGAATSAALCSGDRIAVGSDGSLYISDYEQLRIRKVSSDGKINTVYGNGNFGGGIDGPGALAVAADGNVYFCDTWFPWSPRIRRIGSDGTMSIAAQLHAECRGVAISERGDLYFVEGNIVRKQGPDGVVTTIAGTGNSGFSGDGGPATAADLADGISFFALGTDGSLFISGGNRIRKVGPDGIISTLAGGGNSPFADGKPARGVSFSGYWNPALATAPNGTVYSAVSKNSVTDSLLFRIRKAYPESSEGDLLIPSESGSEYYHFDSSGKHLRTLNALTGGSIRSFGYDANNRLTSITEGSGSVTKIERDSSGGPVAILAPFGQRSVIKLDDKGMVGSITNPAGESYAMTYSPGGLLVSFRDPMGATSTITYDQAGYLLRDANAAGGSWDLAGTATSAGSLVSMTSAMGRTKTFLTQNLGTGDQRRTYTGATGATTIEERGANGVVRTTDPDGTITTTTLTSDPRFGMVSPLRDVSVKLPSGLARTSTTTRDTVLSDRVNPLTVATDTTTTTLNGKAYRSTFDASKKELTYTTPDGFTSRITVDYLGRPVNLLPDPALTPISVTYNDQGFLGEVSQGTSRVTYGYDLLGRRTSTTNALNQTTIYGYDSADRVTSLILPSGRTYLMSYDANGKMTSLTMPAGNVHTLQYTLLGQDKSYTPPRNKAYSWLYDTDREWKQTALPSGRTIEAGYDKGGRPTALVYPEATVEYLYAPGDLTGRISSIVRTPTGGGTSQRIDYTYDGPLVTKVVVSGVTNGSTTYSYNEDFLLRKISFASGRDIVDIPIDLNNDGMVTGFGPFRYTRTGPTGAVTEITDSNGKLTYEYDPLGRMSRKAYGVGGKPIFEASYSYDPLGRITSTTETISGASNTYDYRYDPDGQLIERRKNGEKIESYSYDANGNRIGYQQGSTGTLLASYDAQDRIVQLGGVAYAFDADGFMTKGLFAETRYSARGELMTATTASEKKIDYAYDGTARLVARTDEEGTYQYFYANLDRPFEVSAVRDPEGTLTTLYYDAAGALFAMTRGSATYYVASDHQGSPRIVADTTGKVVKITEYDSYGSPTFDNNFAFRIPIGFAGGIPDVTGLERFGFRDYQPASGRWVSRDPILLRSRQPNLYQYVLNDPVNCVDPEGLDVMVLPRPMVLPRFFPRVAPIGPIDPLIVPLSKIDLSDPSTWPKPPVSGNCTEGPPSRKKPRDRGEKSLYDDKGGEWRPHLIDDHHPDNHWDYKPPGKNQPWQNVPMLPYT